jgi:hypothetical protein
MPETTETKENLIREANVKFADLYYELDAKISAEIKDEDLARLVKATIAEPISQVRHGDHPFKNSQSIDEAVKAMKEDLLQTVIPERIEEDKIAHATAAKAIDALNKATLIDDIDEAFNAANSYFANDAAKEERVNRATMLVLARKYFDFQNLEDSITDKQSFQKAFNSYARKGSDNLQQQLKTDIRLAVVNGLDWLEDTASPFLAHTFAPQHLAEHTYLAHTFAAMAKTLKPTEYSSAAIENKSMQRVVQEIGLKKGIIKYGEF